MSDQHHVPKAVEADPLGALSSMEILAGMGSWEWTTGDDRVVWSDNLYRIYGVEPGTGELSVDAALSYVHPDDLALVRDQAERQRRGAGPQRVEYRIVRPDGSVRHLRSTISLREGSGSRQRMMGWVQDVTDIHQAEAQAQAHLAVSEVLAGWRSLERDGERLLAALGEAMEFVAGALWLPREDALVLRVVWSRPGAGDPALTELLRADRRLPLGAGLPGRAWASREAWTARRLEHEGLAAKPPARPADGDAVAVPVLGASEVLAVLKFLTSEPLTLDPGMRRSLTAIGHELGHFLEQHRGELDPPLLSPREREVLQLAAEGLTGKDIAKRLVISPTTVKTHLGHVYEKLDAPDRAAAVASGMRLGLID